MLTNQQMNTSPMSHQSIEATPLIAHAVSGELQTQLQQQPPVVQSSPVARTSQTIQQLTVAANQQNQQTVQSNQPIRLYTSEFRLDLDLD